MKVTTDNFHQQLQSLWSIESMLVEAMPRMIQKASNFGLQKSLAMHFEETRQHKVAVEAICKGLDINPKAGEPNAELQNILLLGEQAMKGKSAGNDLDAAIIANAQDVEECEMAAYELAGNAAKALGYKGIAGRLFLSFEEERQSDTKLKFLEKSLFSGKAEQDRKEVISMEER